MPVLSKSPSTVFKRIWSIVGVFALCHCAVNGLPWWLRLGKLTDLSEDQGILVRLSDFFFHLFMRSAGVGPGNVFSRRLMNSCTTPIFVTSETYKYAINRLFGTNVKSYDIIAVDDVNQAGIPVRVFHSNLLKETTGTIVFYHGGGFVFGSILAPEYHSFCKRLPDITETLPLSKQTSDRTSD